MYKYDRDWMIAWNPSKEDPNDPEAGVEVGKHPDTTGWSNKYDGTMGMCFSALDNLNDEELFGHLIFLALLLAADGIEIKRIMQELDKIRVWNERSHLNIDRVQI